MRTIVLASTSRFRKKLLQQLQIPFVTDSPRFVEELQQGVAPELLVKHQAQQKALSLRETHPEALIIGADQVFVDHRHRIIGKPGTEEKAVHQLLSMAGQTSIFYTGLAVLDAATGEAAVDYSTFAVTLRPLSEKQIRSYIRRENPLDCAGSFRVEGLGIALMEKLEGADYTALIGLPLILLTSLLEQFGVEVL